MSLVIPSIVERYIYNTFDIDNTEKIVSAGFPITNFIEKSNEEKMILGGNRKLDEHDNISIITKVEPLENKVIPIGLVYNYNMPLKCSQYTDLKIKEKSPKETDDVINEEMFDKLLSKVRVLTKAQKQKKYKTRKHKENKDDEKPNEKSKTRKQLSKKNE
uniref:Uncharacterized protein n=1 Tax=viral metagenome TaxID=1070528 RepID=A0A6C0EAN3_9ZZZZ